MDDRDQDRPEKSSSERMNDYKQAAKERARAARKAAYAVQKERLKEKRKALKESPAYKERQAALKAKRRASYLEQKQKLKTKQKGEVKEEALAEAAAAEREQEARDEVVFSSLRLASEINEPQEPNPTESGPQEELVRERPSLRLIVSQKPHAGSDALN